MKANILVVEDEFITAADIQNSLQEMGFQVPATTGTGEEAIRMAGELAPDLVIMDITLAGRLTGIEAADRIGELYGIPVIFLTAHSDQSMVERSLSSNPYGYIVKPFEPSGLRVSIEMALFKHGMEERLRESERTIQILLNAIPDPLALLDRAKKIVAVNEAMGRKLGKSRAGLVGSPIGDLIDAGALPVSTGEIDLLFQEGTPLSFEEDQAGRWYQTMLHPIPDAGGKTERVAIQSHDITDWKYHGREDEEGGALEDRAEYGTVPDPERRDQEPSPGYRRLCGPERQQVQGTDRRADQDHQRPGHPARRWLDRIREGPFVSHQALPSRRGRPAGDLRDAGPMTHHSPIRERGELNQP